MPELEPIGRPQLVVTGSSGFIGRHLCARLCGSAHDAGSLFGIDANPPSAPVRYSHLAADIRDFKALATVAGSLEKRGTILHLAASAEVVTPWAEIPRLLSSNLEGTHNVLQTLDPRLLIFASSSSVYGNAGLRPVDPNSGPVKPISLYAISKLSGEMMLRDWLREKPGTGVVFRFGNVIGQGCRGLIDYLIGHVRRFPDGNSVARLRGKGKLIRDYVPVEFVTELLVAAARAEWEPGALTTLNLGTGTAMSNGEVAEIVQQAAAALGFHLKISFEDPPCPGEATEVVLDMEDTEKLFGIRPPGPAAVRETIAGTVEQALRPYARTRDTRTVFA